MREFNTPTRCLLCQRNKDEHQGILANLFEEDALCNKCRQSWMPVLHRIKVGGLSVHALYVYDEHFQKAMIQYKECYDEILAPIFLSPQLNQLKRKYKKALFIPAPSSLRKRQERGFPHVEKIFDGLDIEIMQCFEKTKEIKQAHRTKTQRQAIAKEIKLIKIPPSNRRLVFIDDVCTTGATLLTMQDLLKQHYLSCEAIVVACHPLLIKPTCFDKFLQSVSCILKKK